MNKEIQDINHDMARLAEDARVLIAATVDMAGAGVGEARQRLTEALDLGKGNFGRVRDKAMQGAKAADEAVHDHPYEIIGLGLAIGALFGYFVTRRWGCARD